MADKKTVMVVDDNPDLIYSVKEGIMKYAVFLLLSLLALSTNASAQPEQLELLDINLISRFGVPIHLVELFLALFISILSLKFFRITRPLNIFLYIYLALGFFIISTLLYIIFYLRDYLSIELNFANVYIASRLSLIAMLFVFVAVFYNVHRTMKSPRMSK